MKLPDNFKKVTIFSKTLAVILFILFPILGFLYGKFYQTTIDQEVISNLTSANVDLQNQLNTTKEDLSLTLSDEGKYLKSYVKLYSYEEFGVYSPLFKNKKMTASVYRYRGDEIIERVIEMDKGTDGVALSVSTWEFTGRAETLFDKGYEVYSNLRSPRSVESANKAPEVYRTQNREMVFIYSSDFRMSGYSGMTLEGYQVYSSNRHRFYIQISAEGLKAETKNDEQIIRTKASLQKIADTIEYKH